MKQQPGPFPYHPAKLLVKKRRAHRFVPRVREAFSTRKGLFHLLVRRTPPCPMAEALETNDISLPAGMENAPPRDFDCEHYNTCLALAAALNWTSFTCHNCNHCVNSQLVWRAHQCVKDDASLAKLCKLPDLSKKRVA